MAYVRQILIEGLAGRRRRLRVDLDRRINIFWGLNGSGKTALLKILHSALSDDVTPLLRVPFRSAHVQIVDDTRDVVITRSIDKQQITEQAMPIYQMELQEGFELSERDRRIAEMRIPRWTTEPETAPSPRRFRHTYLPIARITDVPRTRRSIHLSVSDVFDESTYDELFAEQIAQRWSQYYTQSLMRVRDIQERGIAEVLQIVLSGGTEHRQPEYIPSEDAFQLVQNFFRGQRMRVRITPRDFAKRYSQDTSAQSVVARIQQITESMDRAHAPQRTLELLVQRLFSGNKSVSFSARDVTVNVGREDIPVASLSSGEKQLLRILIECLAARQSAVLIDEPELSLHVDWQHRLVESMLTVNEDIQLVLATHSPEVMAEVSDEFIIEL